jgi:hypothetical protein
MLHEPYGVEPVPEEPKPDPAVAAAVLEQLCAAQGQTWTLRRAVWGLQGLADGRILAALEGVALECWTQTSEDPSWRVPSDGIGYQVNTLPDGRTARVLTQTRGWSSDPGVVVEVDLDGGGVRATHRAAFTAVMVSRADGLWALRDTDCNIAAMIGELTLLAPDGTHPTTVELGPYNLHRDYFDIRYAPDLLFLQGTGHMRRRDMWVVAVDPPHGRVRRLFPLEWDASRGGSLAGGPGAYLDDCVGRALVHTGIVHDSSGLQPGKAFVVRRAFPTGELQWVFTADHQATALDVDDEFVYVAFNSGELVILRAVDGAVQARQQLRVNDQRVVLLSLARVAADRLVVGTLDGRILDCSLTEFLKARI